MHLCFQLGNMLEHAGRASSHVGNLHLYVSMHLYGAIC